MVKETKENSMKFYYSTGTCSTACHIAFVESGISFTPVEVSWRRKVNVEELAKVNPLGQVPTLVTDDNRIITQNAAILEYIADQKSGLPKTGTSERAEIMSWVAFTAADLQPCFKPFFTADKMTTQEAAKPEIKNFTAENIKRYLDHVNHKLENKKFITGENFTIADAYLFVVIGWCKWAEISTRPYPNIQSFMKRVHDRPAVQKVLQSEGLTDYLPS